MKAIFCIGLLCAIGTSVLGQVKSPHPLELKVPFTESSQAVVVATKDWSATQGAARLFERKDVRSKWKTNGDGFPVVVGRSGLAWSTDSAIEGPFVSKKEGDGKAPAGFFPLTLVFGTSTRPRQLTYPYLQLGKFTECVDDVNSVHYNKIVDRIKVGNFDWKSSEKMFDIRPEYDLGVFVAYNTYPVRPGDGSCIFLHIWKDGATATSGCTAMERIKLERIIAWLDNAKNPYLIQLPEAEYRRFKKKWNLPSI